MLAITLFWIVAFGVMIYFMIKEWKGLSRATRAKVSPSTAASPRSTICAETIRCQHRPAPLTAHSDPSLRRI